MEEWLLMQTFYHGLSSSTYETMDAAARWAFLSLNLRDAKALVENMASNQSWNEEKALTHKRGWHAPAQRGRHVVCQDGPTNEEA
jgi:hypothetical protein